MFEPLRFLHVADASLDRPLGDVGPLPEEWRPLAEDATLMAFDHMIEGAISRNVDCVLLAGDTFSEADESLRARLALVKGLERLNEQGISVFVLPGPLDPASAWQAIPNLPSNVTLLTSDPEHAESELPVAILREGRVIATIIAGTLSQMSAGNETAASPNPHPAGDLPSENGRWTPFRIGMLTAWPGEECLGEDEFTHRLSECGCDYLGVPADGCWFHAGQTRNTRDGIAHHPGPLQPLTGRQTGPHGATLIEVDKAGEIRGTFLPFAGVRRLRFEIPIEQNAELQDITDAMQRLLLDETPQPGERAWFVEWVLQGPSPGWLETADVQSKLHEALPATFEPEGSVMIHHQLRFEESSGHAVGEQNELHRLFGEALDQLALDEAGLTSSVSKALLSSIEDWGEAHWRDRLGPLLSELDAGVFLAQARSLGREWFEKAGGD